MNYVQFHVGDWLTSTRYLSLLEKGVYFDLLMLYYSEERPLIRSYFERITSRYTDEEKKAFDFVISEFFEETDGGEFRHHRCDREIEAYQAKSEKAKKAVQTRWNRATTQSKNVPVGHDEMHSQCERNTTVLPTHNERNANQEPITNNQIDTDMVGRDATPPSASESEALFSEDSERIEKPKNGAPECEYKRVADLYNQKLASKGLPSVAMLSASRKAMVKARWNDFVREENFKTADEVIGGFDYYFDMVSASPFLMGTRDPVSGHSKPFQANFDWLMKSANFLKVLEGNYARGGN